MYADITLLKASPTLTYKVPESLIRDLGIGEAVTIPLRKQEVTGYVSNIYEKRRDGETFKVRNISSVTNELPKLDSKYIDLLKWVSSYYHYPLGEVIKAALPPRKKPKQENAYFLNKEKAQILTPEEEEEFAKRGGKRLRLIELLQAEDYLTLIPPEYKSAYQWLHKNGYIDKKKIDLQVSEAGYLHQGALSPVTLNEWQELSYRSLVEKLDSGAFNLNVLHGVTGSGKTEVYLAAARHCLANKKSVLILVPEIALTPQLLERVQSRLGAAVCVLHSELSDYERYQQWTLVNEGRVSVVIGARSSVFAPIKNLGLVVVDEEHECSFKQEDRLRYNARDMAIVLAKLNNSTVVLGSATPSIESYYQISSGKAQLHELSSQHFSSHKPEIIINDMRKEKSGTVISNLLARKISDTLAIGKQSILFLNRRGYASWLHCDSCGHVPECLNCSVSLTYYERNNTLRCHYCGHSENAGNACGACGLDNLQFGAIGTEAVEKELNERFPLARVARIDRDIVSQKGQLEQILADVKSGEIDIVVGTQMIAKGHDFPGVQLAAVLNADDSLNIPDFRAGERTYQLLTQVSGRAGRRGDRGISVIQTFDPENPYVQFAANHDFENFVKYELEFRQANKYPPFARLARILISAASPNAGQMYSEKIARHIESQNAKEITVLGPAPAMLQKLQNRFRWNILLKASSPATLNTFLRTMNPIWRDHLPSGISLSIDVDPSSLL